jgi:hypothetical protein
MSSDIIPNIDDLLSNTPDELKGVIEKYNDQLKEAIISGDMDALEELKRLIIEELKNMKGDSEDDDDDGFNMNDFIGGSI